MNKKWVVVAGGRPGDACQFLASYRWRWRAERHAARFTRGAFWFLGSNALRAWVEPIDAYRPEVQP